MTDLRRIVVRQDATGRSFIHMAGNPMADAANNLKSGVYLVIPDRTVPSPEAIEAAAPITRELTSLLPVEFEGSHDATVWTIAIVNAFIAVQFGVSND